ncbi:integrase-like protein [Roseibium hamelinense]|uniref:Integrase-like protein n=1 Tax=Roseibium hamelinense TaxID=150831 RepID=A0A562SDI9_9HYPH|nr:hypothetical protein [Roseibium hamelinense]TWI78730.1 integrase-like protein [Roseibium hamelinense]
MHVSYFAHAVQDWTEAFGAKTTYIEPGSPFQRFQAIAEGSAWENGYCNFLHSRFRDEFLNGEIFYSLNEALILIED